MDQTVVVILITILILVAWLGSNYRALIDSRKELDDCDKQLARAFSQRQQLAAELPGQLDSQLQSKPELFAELADKQKVAAAAAAVTASIDERQMAENDLAVALGKLFHGLEQEDAVLDDEKYLSMRGKLLDIEDEIAAASAGYNEMTGRLNAQLKVFPTSIIASRANIKAQQPLDVRNPFERYGLKFKATMPTKKEPSVFRDRAGKSAKGAENENSTT